MSVDGMAGVQQWRRGKSLGMDNLRESSQCRLEKQTQTLVPASDSRLHLGSRPGSHEKIL